MEFETGDTVRLKSGGPLMTVEQTGEHYSVTGPAVWCVWFEKVGSKQNVQRDTFPAAGLQKAEKTSAASFSVIRS